MTQAPWLADLRFAFGLLTRFPVGSFGLVPPRDAARAGWAYPVAGAAVGAVSALALAAPDPMLAAALAYGLAVLATGGLHEDALADVADAAGAAHRGGDAARAAMKDSAIGAMGALALIADAALRIASLAALAAAGPWIAAAGLIAAGALSRAAAVAFLAMGERESGLAAQVGRPGRGVTALALAFGGGAMLSAGALAPPLFALMLGAAPALWLARRGAGYAGGMNGDAIGAGLRGFETGGLVCAAIAMGVFA